MGLLAQYRNDLQAGRQHLLKYNTQVVKKDRYCIEYFQTGGGVPLLVSHGITGGFDQGLSLVETYISGNASDFNVIAVSRFGYLGSSLPRASSPAEQANAYNSLLESLNIEQVIMFGNSAGGTSAMRFALQYPDKCRGLILLSSTMPPNPSMPPKPIMRMVFGIDFLYWLMIRLFGQMMLSMFLPKSIIKSLSKEELQSIMQGIFISPMPISRRTRGTINDMFISNPDINSGYPFNEISVPTLIIHAVDDPACRYTGAEEISRQIPNCHLLSFESGGHLLVGKEESIKAAINDFVCNLS